MKTLLRTFVLLALLLPIPPVLATGMLDVKTSLEYPEAMAMLQEAIARRGYTVARIQQVDKGLESGGYASGKQYRVVHFARKEQLALANARYPQLLAWLPLRIAVMEIKDGTRLIALRPDLPWKNTAQADSDLATLLSELDTDLRHIIKAATAY